MLNGSAHGHVYVTFRTSIVNTLDERSTDKMAVSLFLISFIPIMPTLPLCLVSPLSQTKPSELCSTTQKSENNQLGIQAGRHNMTAYWQIRNTIPRPSFGVPWADNGLKARHGDDRSPT